MGVPGVVRRMGGSGASCAPQLFKGELAGCLPTALSAVVDVTPGPEQAGALVIQQNNERLGYRVYVQPEIRTPTGRCRVALQIETLQDTTKAHPLRIEEPSAVTRFQDERFHGWIIAPERDEQDSGALRFREDRREREDLPTLRLQFFFCCVT